jgi:hypothetical protein
MKVQKEMELSEYATEASDEDAEEEKDHEFEGEIDSGRGSGSEEVEDNEGYAIE